MQIDGQVATIRRETAIQTAGQRVLLPADRTRAGPERAREGAFDVECSETKRVIRKSDTSRRRKVGSVHARAYCAHDVIGTGEAVVVAPEGRIGAQVLLTRYQTAGSRERAADDSAIPLSGQ